MGCLGLSVFREEDAFLRRTSAAFEEDRPLFLMVFFMTLQAAMRLSARNQLTSVPITEQAEISTWTVEIPAGLSLLYRSPTQCQTCLIAVAPQQGCERESRRRMPERHEETVGRDSNTHGPVT